VLVIGIAGLAAMAVRLLISAIVRSSDRAMALLPVVLIAQVVVSVPFFATRSAVLDPVGVVSSAQWTMAAAASTTDLSDVRSVDLAVTGAGRSALVDRELPANSKRAPWRGGHGQGAMGSHREHLAPRHGSHSAAHGRCARAGRDRPAAPGPVRSAGRRRSSARHSADRAV
jgi:hypothetical protein